MSKTLLLIGAGWDSVRSMAAHGQHMDILNRLRSLLARPDLPASVACEAHRMAGELLVQAEQYREARLHLRTAAAIEPSHAQTFYLWGLAFERDPLGCDLQAAKKFGSASKLAPEDPRYRAAFGRAAVRSDRKKRGIRELHIAASLAPGDVAVIRVVTEGLLEAGQLKMAGRVLNRARFLSFESSKDRELLALMERVRFESARCVQRETKRHRQDADYARDGGRMVIPFVGKVKRRAGKAGSNTDGSTRRDVVSLPKPHFPRLRIGRADR
jgi:tetratricopeptide (TPR) repeat protein